MQKWKRSLLGLAGSVMISGGMILNPLLDGMALQAFAMTEKEWNNNRGDANPFDPGNEIKGTIDNEDDDDYYRFVLDEAGEFSVDITSYMKTYTLTLYKSDDRIWEAAKKSIPEGSGSRKDSYKFDLDIGTYYLKVSGNNTTGDYRMETDFDDLDSTERESNDKFSTANSFTLGTTIRGMIGMNDEYDYYKFEVSTDQKVTFNVKSYVGSCIFRIYDGNEKKIWDSDDQKIESGKDYKKFSKEIDLSKGTYYICFTNSGDKGAYTGKYQIETKGTASNYNETEYNGSIESANNIGLPTEIRGRIGEGDEYDYFKFTVSASGNLNVDVKSWLEKCSVRLFDANGSRITAWDMDRSSEEKEDNKPHYEGNNYKINSGTYYICFTNRDGEYKGDYVINLSMDGQSPTPTTNPTPTNSPTPTTTPAPTPAVNNTFNKSDAMNGVKVIDNSHTLWLGATANGNFTDAVITDASGNIDTSVDNYIANIVTKRDANNNPVEFYSLVFSDGRWDTNYDSRTRGSYVFMGEEYFVAGGVINQSANGLNYTGEANGWRFLAAGKVVKGKGGLVMYQDEWFWIDDAGKCDNNYAAIVRWNGGDFLVHGGRLRTDFTGFSYDPQNKNAWYHIEKGQVWGDGLITDKTIEGSMMTRNVVKGVAQ